MALTQTQIYTNIDTDIHIHRYTQEHIYTNRLTNMHKSIYVNKDPHII